MRKRSSTWTARFSEQSQSVACAISPEGASCGTKGDMAAYLDGLNPAQRQAVEHTGGPLLIIAGAGTGKTRTLACRVAHLIASGVPADRILLLTFTRRAAREMITRAGRLVADDSSSRVWGGTFHSVANRLLRHYGTALELSPNFTVMDESDVADLMGLVRADLGLTSRDHRFPRKETLARIYSQTVNLQRPLDEVLDKHFPWCRDHPEEIGRVFDAFVERKQAQQVLDYDDLLLFWSALCAHPRVGKAVADRFEHILVDEYQDTNAIQAEIVRGMRRWNNNVTVVGDDAQSIYSFRAATIRNMLDFPTQFPGTTQVKLEQNYRSVEPILAASNAVMDEAKERFTKRLWSTRRSERKPVLIVCDDEPQQSEEVCRRILEHFEQGVALIRQAVLFRTGHHSAHLEIELARRNLPFHKFGGLKFVEAAHVKDLLAILRILENPYDEISWFRVLRWFEGIGPRSAERIMRELGVRRTLSAHARDGRLGEGMAKDSDQAGPIRRLLESCFTAPAAAREMFDSFQTLVRDCLGGSKDGDESAPSPALDVQIERARLFLQPFFERQYDRADIRMRDLEQLARIASRYRSRGRFLADVTLDPPASTSDLAGAPHLDEDYLTLSTIHSAKGCEWDVVYVIHAADGNVPSDMAVQDDAGIEEERRLFYVALTRAKDYLYVHVPLRYYHRKVPRSDAHSYAQPSRFLTREVLACFERTVASAPQQEWADAEVVKDATRPYDRIGRLWRTQTNQTPSRSVDHDGVS